MIKNFPKHERRRVIAKVQTKIKQLLIPIALIAVVIVIVFFVLNDQSEPVPPREKVVQTGSELLDFLPIEPAEDSSEPDELTALESDFKAARRIKSEQIKTNESYKSDKFEAKSETDWKNEFEAQAELESALAGDIDDAIAVSELVGQCRAGYDNENSVQSGLSRLSQNVKQGRPLPGLLSTGTGETLQFKSFVEYEEFVWDRFAQCQSTRGMFDQNLRNRLEQMAEGGNVNARYLYAMWIPTQKGASTDDLINWMTYQSLAMEFTWRNIREGEPLGLLAYGRSLEQTGHVYFSPVHKRYGPAFILAAYKCGLDNRTVNQKVANMTGFWKQRNMLQSANQAEDLSDVIVNTFCH